MAFARRTGDLRSRDWRSRGRREGSSGRRISLGMLAMMFDNAIR